MNACGCTPQGGLKSRAIPLTPIAVGGNTSISHTRCRRRLRTPWRRARMRTSMRWLAAGLFVLLAMFPRAHASPADPQARSDRRVAIPGSRDADVRWTDRRPWPQCNLGESRVALTSSRDEGSSEGCTRPMDCRGAPRGTVGSSRDLSQSALPALPSAPRSEHRPRSETGMGARAARTPDTLASATDELRRHHPQRTWHEGRRPGLPRTRPPGARQSPEHAGFTQVTAKHVHTSTLRPDPPAGVAVASIERE